MSKAYLGGYSWALLTVNTTNNGSQLTENKIISHMLILSEKSTYFQ